MGLAIPDYNYRSVTLQRRRGRRPIKEEEADSQRKEEEEDQGLRRSAAVLHPEQNKGDTRVQHRGEQGKGVSGV